MSVGPPLDHHHTWWMWRILRLQWGSSQIPPLQVPTPTWGSHVSNAELLGTARVGGRPVWVVSFVNSSIPAFFTAWIDQSSYRTLQLRMTAAAHFMFQRYTAFNRPVRIVPPRRSRG